mgnify:CR=1 FL=1
MPSPTKHNSDPFTLSIFRLGIATLLYHHLEDEARIQGLDELVTEASLVARDFFAFLGFEVDGDKLKLYCGDNAEHWMEFREND